MTEAPYPLGKEYFVWFFPKYVFFSDTNTSMSYIL
jgi:hypothetical protein